MSNRCVEITQTEIRVITDSDDRLYHAGISSRKRLLAVLRTMNFQNVGNLWWVGDPRAFDIDVVEENIEDDTCPYYEEDPRADLWYFNRRYEAQYEQADWE